MKKSLLALAVLSAFAGAAAAQSSITIYGIVDANVGKDPGTDDKRVGQGAQSRLGFRGVEDLGNGLRATFNIQTRFDSGTGANQGTPVSSTSPFFQAEANVGLAGNFGNVRAGRQYTEAFYAQIAADPWGYDTVASLKTILEGGVAGTRTNNSVSYWITNAGITFGIQTGEAAENGVAGSNQATPGSVAAPNIGQKRPVNARLAYSAGPIFASVSYENPPDQDDNWTVVNGSYNFGAYKVGLFLGDGKNAAAIKRKAVGGTVTAPFGPGEARVEVAQLKGPATLGGADILQRRQVGAGYFYSLSKRTVVYGDVVKLNTDNASLLPAGNNFTSSGIFLSNGKKSDTGYDFGIKHSF